MLSYEDGKCITCSKEIDPNIIYCDSCYEIVENDRMKMVRNFQSEGLSFEAACQGVADIHEIEKEDIELLFR